jgi:hypothetical protein
MATLPPHRLARHHATREIPGAEGWQERSSEVIKQLYYNWRSRTVELLQLATGHKERFDRGYVVDLIREELGAFFREPCGGEQTEENDDEEDSDDEETKAKRLDEALAKVADLTVRADCYMQASPVAWQFYVTDPATGRTSGFALNSSPTYGGPKMAATHPMETHVVQSTNMARAVGRPVQHIVRPLLLSHCLDREAFSFDRLFHICPMAVIVDMYGKESDKGQEVEEGEKSKEG